MEVLKDWQKASQRQIMLSFSSSLVWHVESFRSIKFCPNWTTFNAVEAFFVYGSVLFQVTQLTDKCVIASCGMKSDAITLHKHLKARLVGDPVMKLQPF